MGAGKELQKLKKEQMRNVSSKLIQKPVFALNTQAAFSFLSSELNQILTNCTDPSTTA